MRSEIVDVLLEIGIPANVKGFTYIHDAMDLFDTDTYYSSGKICSLYAAIAKKRNTKPSSVERAIHHAFETAISKGNRESVEYYLDLINTQNSNLLRTLFLRMKQEEGRKFSQPAMEARCNFEHCIYREQLYQEALEKVSAEMSARFLQIINDTKKEALSLHH